MLQAGLGTYAFKTFFGRPIDRHAFNYLGEKKGYLLQIVIYVGMFFYSQAWLSKQKHLDINHLLNPREKTGEIMMQIILAQYPHKVDHKKLREIMLEKSQYNLMQLNRFEQGMHNPQNMHIAKKQDEHAAIQ